MFLNKFNIDKLPYLYILIAGGGGVLAYLYTPGAPVVAHGCRHLDDADHRWSACSRSGGSSG
jgi:hypothetical protein